jgi:hypothetical protein
MKNLLLVAFLCFGSYSNAQLTESKFHLEAKYSLGGIDTAFYNNYGANFEWFVHRNIGINYSLDYLNRNDNYRSIHTPMGLLAAPISLLVVASSPFSFNSGNTLWFLLLMLAIPDGISLHIPYRYKWDFSPYANVLGLDFVKNSSNDQSWIKYGCSFGIKATYMLNDRFTAASFIETRHSNGFGWGFGGGASLGFVFKQRD